MLRLYRANHLQWLDGVFLRGQSRTVDPVDFQIDLFEISPFRVCSSPVITGLPAKTLVGGVSALYFRFPMAATHGLSYDHPCIIGLFIYDSGREPDIDILKF